MCYKYPGPRCSAHALKTLQAKRDAFLAASAEHIAVRREIETLLDKGLDIPSRLDERYGEAMSKVAAAKREKDQAQADFDSTPAGQKKIETAMEMLCTYEPHEWTQEHADRLEHFMDRLEAGRALRARQMRDLRKAEGHVELAEEDEPQPRSYGDMYFDIEAARKPKPVFVYGSLMSGLHNSPLIGQTKTSVDGEVQGVALFANGHHFPYAVKAEGMNLRASGELIEVDDHRFAVTLFRLDQLEGYDGPDGDNHYNRVLTTVTTADGRKVEAWMYVAEESVGHRVAQRLPLIRSGSWRDHLSQADSSREQNRAAVSASSSTTSQEDTTPPWE